MKPRFTLGLALCLAAASLCAGAPVDWVARLHSPDIETRRTAVDEIQTLEDPRIPDACLPLLRDEGLSIRRQAARAIGSRSNEIPKQRLPEFVAALRRYRQETREESPTNIVWEQTRNVADRSLGLLTHDFSSPMFAMSPDGKWVLYEERRRPMIADTRLAARRLLAPEAPSAVRDESRVERGEIVRDLPGHPTRLLKLMVTNEPVEYLFHPRWHPASIALELQPDIQARFFTPRCLWRARDGACRVFTVKSFQRLYGKRFPHWGTILDFVMWKGPKAIFKIHDCDDPGGGLPFDPKGILVSVNIDTWKIALE